MPTFREYRVLPYGPEEMFDLVADVERYPEFLPWVEKSRITRRDGPTLFVDMAIRFGPLRASIASAGRLHRPESIDITSRDPLLAHFGQRWTFEPKMNGTCVTMRLDVTFRSRVLRTLTSGIVSRHAAAMVEAFHRRAETIYGAPIKTCGGSCRP